MNHQKKEVNIFNNCINPYKDKDKLENNNKIYKKQILPKRKKNIRYNSKSPRLEDNKGQFQNFKNIYTFNRDFEKIILLNNNN